MKSGIDIILDDLKDSNAKIRILTTDYLNITQPEALYTLKDELPEAVIHFYSTWKLYYIFNLVETLFKKSELLCKCYIIHL